MNIGFIQGRLSPIVNGMIQAFPWDHWQKELEIASENEFNMIEWTLDYENLKENPFLSAQGQDEILALQQKYNFSIPSLTGDFFMHKPFFKYQGNERSELLEELKLVVSACSKLGTKYLVIPLVDNGSLKSSDDEQVVIESLLKLTDFLTEKNVSIIFESDYKPKELSNFIEKLPHPLFGINYDSGNSAALDYNIDEEFANYKSRILNIHIKDRVKGGTTVALGTGNTDFNSLFSNIKNSDYKGNLILQTARAEDSNHLSTLKKYREFVINGLQSV